MQGSGEKFHHYVLSLVIDRKVFKEFLKSYHVRFRTFSIDAGKTREEILITRRHSPGVSRDFTHI
jgi:hypothetical protein